MKSKERTKASGEVFTPRSLIHEMLEKLPNEVWFDPFKTWLEPSAGDGNFLVEIKARLIQAGHKEKHVLDHMIYGIELIDDNHWVLQHRLGYFKDGKPNDSIWNASEIAALFVTSKIHPLTQDLNQRNPYHLAGLCEADEVLHHRNMVCWSALEYDMSFGRTQAQQEADEKLRKILPGFEIEITEELIRDAIMLAPKLKDEYPRTPQKKIADALMIIAEKAFYKIGIPRSANIYEDVNTAASSLLPGRLEIKTVDPTCESDRIRIKDQFCDFVAIYERDFDIQDLVQVIFEDPYQLVGMLLGFKLREIRKK